MKRVSQYQKKGGPRPQEIEDEEENNETLSKRSEKINEMKKI